MTMTTLDDGPPPIRLFPLFLKFLRFGCLAFGGPVAQIAMLRQTLVEEERWLSGPRFNRLLAVMQILPGPEAHELCVHMGMMARGRIGGLLAGLGFMLPGLLLMLVAAWLYRDWIAGAGWALPVLFGIQLVVLAIIARAVQRIGGHVLEDRLLWALAIGAFAATLLGTPFWIPLLAAGLVYGFRARPMVIGVVLVGAVMLALLLHKGSVAVAPVPTVAGGRDLGRAVASTRRSVRRRIEGRAADVRRRLYRHSLCARRYGRARLVVGRAVPRRGGAGRHIAGAAGHLRDLCRLYGRWAGRRAGDHGGHVPASLRLFPDLL